MEMLVGKGNARRECERPDLPVMPREMGGACGILEALIFQSSDDLVELDPERIKLFCKSVELVVQLSELDMYVSDIFLQFSAHINKILLCGEDSFEFRDVRIGNHA